MNAQDTSGIQKLSFSGQETISIIVATNAPNSAKGSPKNGIPSAKQIIKQAKLPSTVLLYQNILCLPQNLPKSAADASPKAR